MELVYFLQLFIAFCTLLIASYYDYKTRLIPNRLWLFSGTIAIMLTSYSIYTSQFPKYELFVTGLSILFGLIIGASIYLIVGLADIKAIIVLSILVPYVEPINGFPIYHVSTTPFVFELLVNTIPVMVLLSLLVAMKNLYHGDIPSISNISYLFEGTKVNTTKLPNIKHVWVNIGEYKLDWTTIHLYSEKLLSTEEEFTSDSFTPERISLYNTLKVYKPSKDVFTNSNENTSYDILGILTIHPNGDSSKEETELQEYATEIPIKSTVELEREVWVTYQNPLLVVLFISFILTVSVGSPLYFFY